MICCAGQIDEKGLYVQGQGLLPQPRQCEGTRPSVYQLCSQCANSYITMTTLVWGWQWIKHIFGTLKRLASLDSTIDPGIQHCSKWAINQVLASFVKLGICSNNATRQKCLAILSYPVLQTKFWAACTLSKWHLICGMNNAAISHDFFDPWKECKSWKSQGHSSIKSNLFCNVTKM